MSLLFATSYVLLLCVIAAEAVLIRGVLGKVIWFQNFFRDSIPEPDSNTSQVLGSVPEFSLPSLETGLKITTDRLKGAASVLCFVSPGSVSAYQNLLPALHAWWHGVEGHVYIVCHGTEEACKYFVAETARGFPLTKVICDQQGILAQSLGITEIPQAAELDADLKVRRYGRPENVEIDVHNGAGKRGFDSNERAIWPENRPISGAGFARVDTPISCVLSRFELRSYWSVIPFYLAFRRIQKAARGIDGLMHAVLLFEGLRTCYTLSFWRDDWSIVEFGRVRAHIDAANSAFDSTYRDDLKRAEIWSAQFRLWAVSCHNMNWDQLDLQHALGDQWQRREGCMTTHWEERPSG
jgi:hypothetical protein